MADNLADWCWLLCALKAGDVELSEFDVEMEAERIAMEMFVHHHQQQQQQHHDATVSAGHSDILVLDDDTAGSRASSSKKSQKKLLKQR